MNTMLSLPTVETRRPDTTSLLPLEQYDLAIVSFSGGKDSLAMLLNLLELRVPRDKIQLWHQHVDGEPGVELNGFMDWPCTASYCRAIAKGLGVRILFQWKHGGFEREMLRENNLTAPVSYEQQDESIGTSGGKRGKLSTRLKFPQVSADLSVRWCSAYVKIDPCAMAIAGDPALKNSRILFLTGERRQESTARSRYAEFERHRCTNNARRVDQWRMVIDWTEQQVWEIIRRWRIVPHPAYRIGFSRVSCMACIFGMADQWASVRQVAPAKFARILEYERRFGISIKKGRTLEDQADAGSPYPECYDDDLVALAMGHQYPENLAFVSDGQEWQLPAGAYRRGGGPA